MTYTENLADLGYRERAEFIEILKLWQRDGLPSSFWEGDVKLGYNSASGFVFLTNNEYQTCMRREDALEMWYVLTHSGEEGFLGDLLEEWEVLHEEDQDYLCDVARNEDKTIALCVSKDTGSVCFAPESEEFGVVKGEKEAWFGNRGSCKALFVEVNALPEGDDDEG